MADSTPLLLTLLRLIKELRRNYDGEVRELGLSFSRARVLSALMRQDGATQAELAAELDMAAPSMKRQLDLLEAEGLVERRGLGNDARKRALFLTPRARALPITRYMDNIRDKLLDGVSSEERVQLLGLLERLAENATRMNNK